MKFILFVSLCLVLGIMSFQIENEKEESIKRGEDVYIFYCQKCHMADGKGGENLYPPVAGSDYLFNNIDQSIQILMLGSNKDILVNGKTHDMDMEPSYLSDKEIADVMNYILNSWENTYDGTITEDQVASLR